MSRKYLPFIVVIALIALVLFVRFGLSGNEDTWLCDNGQWVRHGNPSAPMPSEGCGGLVPTRLDFSSSSPSASSATAQCPAYVNCMPGPDVNRTCIIPPGCENITQKAY